MQKRSDSEIIKEIAQTYSSLSPENLYCDGERSRAQAAPIARKLQARLKALFIELGREMGEVESYYAVRNK
jgi:hypothetical protein